MGKPQIICVDDEKDILGALEKLLTYTLQSEYEIITFDNGKDTVAHFTEHSSREYDIPLVIADYTMPGMMGDELLIQLNKLNPHTKKILLTGDYTVDGIKNVYEKANLYRFIEKPWNVQDLTLTVNEALKSYYRAKNLIKMEGKFRRIFEHAVEGIFQTTLEGDIIVINPELAKILGYSSPEEGLLFLNNIKEVYVKPADRNELLKKLTTSQSAVEMETRFLKKDGSIIWVEIYAGPVINDKGEIVKIEGFIRDITEKKKVQKRLEFFAAERDQYLKELESIIERRTEELRSKNREILEINENLKKLSITDSLTGLFNRYKLDADLAGEHERASRYGEIFSLILIDIDTFKKINDNYGHQVGDSVLIEIAAILKESVRKVDIVGRWGGEEFVIILPKTDLEGTITIAEKLRHNVEAHPFTVVGRVTISVGVAASRETESIAEVIRRADDNLYEAKKKGRNRVEYNVEPEMGSIKAGPEI